MNINLILILVLFTGNALALRCYICQGTHPIHSQVCSPGIIHIPHAFLATCTFDMYLYLGSGLGLEKECKGTCAKSVGFDGEAKFTRRYCRVNKVEDKCNTDPVTLHVDGSFQLT